MDPLRLLLRHPVWRRAGFVHLRALALLCHVVVVVVVACPAPLKGGSKSTWEKPGVRAEVRAWQGRLAAVGVDVSEAELVDFGSSVAARWGRTRNRFVAPLSTYLRDVGAPQGWYMFTAPDRTPQRFGVDVVGADGTRRRAFVLGEPSAWPALASDAFLDEHRVRRALFQSAWSERATAMREVCSYFGRRARATDASVVEVRCFQLQADVIHPWRLSLIHI